MFRTKTWAAALLSVLLFSACNSDKWLGRQWHNTNAHYNLYFNANEKWDLTVLGLRENSKDDYRSFILLYNYGTPESLKGNQGTMDEVIKKASTMIDKHPKSRWVDDAYLLIGKGYFMKGDFIAATDLFEFVNTSFKDPKIQYAARLWIFQCLLFRGKLAEAENLAVSLKNDKEFPAALLPQLHLALGAIYLKNNKPGQAVEFLELALAHTRPKMDRYRLHYALGQAYQQLEKYDLAEAHYAKVVKMNPPYEMAFNARINQVEILSLQKQDYAKANQLLRRMLKDDKNLEYFGQIYYRLGRNEMRAGNTEKALAYLNQSLRNSANDRAQSTTTYLTLGDYYYDRKNYERAGTYYDSANGVLDERHPDYASISKKSLLLGDLLRHLITIKKQDSLLRLARNPELRERTIDRLIEEEKRQAANPGKKPNNPPPPDNIQTPGNIGTQNMGSFPFYNPTIKARGIQDFQKSWGTRPNRDYWRIASKKPSGASLPDGSEDADTTTKKGQDTSLNNVSADRKRFYAEIPMTPEAQKSAEAKIEDALFNAAGMYQNSFGEKSTAAEYYKELLRRFPKSKYEAQVLYELAKMARESGNTAEFNEYHEKLATRFPESIYLKLLDDPGAIKNQLNNGYGAEKKEIEDLYAKMYEAYVNEQYEQALAIKSEADKKYAGNNLQIKFDYLQAICLLKLGSTEKGLKGLRQLIADCPDTEIARRAQSTLDAYAAMQNPVVAVKDTTGASTPGGLWKSWDATEELFFIIVYQKGANSGLLRASLNDFNKENFVFENLEVSEVRSAGETIYFSVNNFSKPQIALDYLQMLMGKADFFASKGLFEYELAWISKSNYQTLTANNRINSYLDFFKSDKK